jgi:hypothetical protein
LRLAVDQGDLAADCDVECLADLALAPLFFRLLVGHAPVTPSFAQSCVRHLVCENAPQLRQPRQPEVAE